MEVTISDWAWFNKADLPAGNLERIKARLIITPRRTSPHQRVLIPIHAYYENSTRIGIPREYFLRERKLSHQLKFDMSDGREVHVRFEGELKKDQQEAVDKLMSDYKAHGTGGIIQAPPGSGKTVSGLGFWVAYKRTCIVVVQKGFLLNQWKERIKQFVPAARVGIIQQDQCQFGDDFDISIAMIQSLAKRKDSYPNELWNWPGLVITDEVHRISARTWAKVVPSFAARYRVGLSATPRRKDGTQNVFFWHIGKVLYQSRAKRVKPKLRRIFTEFDFRVTPKFNPNRASKEIQLRFLCSNPDRNRLIVDELTKAVTAGRKVIVLSCRRGHLEKLSVIFDKVKPQGCIIDFFVGGRSQAELNRAEKANVMFCTYQMAEEALDVPQLDTVFLTTPMSDVEQSVGRIMRYYSGKKDPVVVDFIDGRVKSFLRLWNTRLRFYVNHGMFKEKKKDG